MTRKVLSEKTKKQIAKLVDKDFMRQIMEDNLPKYYSDFVSLKRFKLDPYKRHLGVTSAVFVVEYKLEYLDKNKEVKKLDIFASAHSDGSRKPAYEKTRFLYDNGFDKGKYRVTRPLFFLPQQQAFVYEASLGRSLFNFFTQNPKEDLRPAFSLVAGWIKKLHEFDLGNFSWPQFKISTMIPEPERFIKDFYDDNKKQGKIVDDLFNDMNNLENKFFHKIQKRLIYGDNHPENIIIKSLEAKDLEMIDFTDIALGDPMMDIGTFLQQFDFMGHNFISRQKMNEYKIFFVENYFAKKIDEIDAEYFDRINLYQSWTALRTAIFLFYMKDVNNPILDLLQDSRNYLKLAHDNKKNINLH